jgi:hypothetical protein
MKRRSFAFMRFAIMSLAIYRRELSAKIRDDAMRLAAWISRTQ